MEGKKLDYAFHIHTARCGHASSDSEEDYIKYAIKNDMHVITFTDHVPFPGDPFTGRMKMNVLDEYIYAMNRLKEKYKEYIKVYSGFEVEYISEYMPYYQKLSKMVDVMILGQHHAKMADGCYTFERNVDKSKIHDAILRAVVEGMKTGLFSVLAHPDRYFHSAEDWTEKDEKFKNQIFRLAQTKCIKLERNLGIYEKTGYNMSFWANLPNGVQTIYGLDAHSLESMFRMMQVHAVSQNNCVGLKFTCERHISV